MSISIYLLDNYIYLEVNEKIMRPSTMYFNLKYIYIYKIKFPTVQNTLYLNVQRNL